MSLIRKITPINLEEEKAKFFNRSFLYNPKFKYIEPVDKNWLTRYGLPEPSLIKLASKLVTLGYKDKKHNELKLEEGKPLDQGAVYKLIKQFLTLHKLENRYQVVVDPRISSRATATSIAIKLHPEARFSREGLLSMLYHEIGTHVLRRINYEKQPWYKKKKKHGLVHNYLKTEEGLATLHGHLPRKNKLAYRAALKYLAVAKAQQMDFKSLFAWSLNYLGDPEHAWRFCVRLKRGLEDTSQPGGFTKDLVYFAGFVKVWRWLKKHDFNPTKLYIGKVALEDLEKAWSFNPDYQPVLPSFYLADPNKYKQKVKEIGEVNFLS